jgi:hypothetical protein
MINDLHRLRDLLTALEYDPEDDVALIEALDLIEKLIAANEKPDPTRPVGLCYTLPTPKPPVPVAPAPVAPPPAPKPPAERPRRFVDQAYSEKPPRKPRQTKVKPNAAA